MDKFISLLLLVSISILVILTIIIIKYHHRVSSFLILNTSLLRFDSKKGLIIDKNRKTLEQALSFSMFIKLSIQDNFKGDKPNSNVLREISDSKKDLKKFFRETQYTEFETTTNETMLKQLEKLEKLGIILVEKKKYDGVTEVDIINKKQMLPKLILMGMLTTIKNIFNKKYWDYIRQEENVGVYIIRIL